MPDVWLNRERGVGDRVQARVGGHPQAVEQVQEVFSGQVTRGARREGTSAQSACRGVEPRHTCLEAGVHVDERGAACVVEVQGDAADRDSLRDLVQQV